MKIAKHLLLANIAIGSVCGSTAMAQTEPAQAQAQAEALDVQDVGLEEIIVTAQRVETNLQRTPVAVTSLSSDALKERGVTNIADLSAIAPNVSIGARSGSGTASGAVTIRGIGIDANPPASAAVGIYVDEVYYPSSFGNLLGVFDVARIEVLRGPQGTLFGRNTISGAIQYVTKRPELGGFSGFAEGTIGNLDRREISGGINLPLGEIAAIRISGLHTERDGYIRDVLNGINRGGYKTDQGRIQLHVEPAPNLTIDLKAELVDTQTNGRASIAAGFNYATVFGAAFAPSGLDPFISPDPYTNAGFNARDDFNARFETYQATIAYDISETLRIKSISAIVKTQSQLYTDLDNTPVPLISNLRGNVEDDVFTQELQLTGQSFADRLNWTLGIFYYDSKTDTRNNVAFIGPAQVRSDPFGDFVLKIKSYAVYGQATFNLTDQFALVAGLRYTKEDQRVANVGSLPLAPAYTEKQSFSDTSPLIGLNFQASDDALFYAKASKGFRAGGFSPTVVNSNAYRPETAWTYEAGARLHMFERRLRVNPTIFQTDWKDIQFNQLGFCTCFPGPLPFINNAGDARIRGIELESEAAITDAFVLTFSGGYLDGKYTRIAPILAGKLTLNSDLKRAPEFNYALGGRFTQPVGDGKIIASANYAWQDFQRSATTDIDFVPIPAYGLLTARIEYRSPGDRFTIAAYSTNLADRTYRIGGSNYGAGGTIPTYQIDIGAPREYGVTARVNF